MARSEPTGSHSGKMATEAEPKKTSRPRRVKPAAVVDGPVAPSVAQVTAMPSAASAAATEPISPGVATADPDNNPEPQVVAPAPGEPRRFDVFVVDVGWKTPVAEALRNNLDKCLRYQHCSTVYILSPDQCARFFLRHPSAIGNEPSIIIIDRDACAVRRSQGFGFKMNLGLIRDFATANSLLKWVMAVLAEQKPGSDITEPIRTVIHKEGIRGAIDILADIAHSPVGEAMTH